MLSSDLPMPQFVISHFSPAPIRPGTTTHTAYQRKLKNPQTKTCLVAPNHPANTSSVHKLPAPNSPPRSPLRRSTESPACPAVSANHRGPQSSVPLPSSLSPHVGVLSEYSDTLNEQNHDFLDPNPSFTTHPRQSTSTVLDLSSFGSQGGQEVVTFLVVQPSELIALQTTRLFPRNSRGTVALTGGMQ